MNKGKKRDRSCTDGAPIHNNCNGKAGLPLPLRELADLLAELAVKQLKESHASTKKGAKK